MNILNILIFQDKIILLILTAIIGYLSGISNPKLDSLILHSVPEDKQTSIYSIFSTIITLTVPFGKICQGHKQNFFDKFISSLFLS